ncbi:fpn-1.2 [Pristionchus pacificus]|uniref:Solute carrier family 40 member n=1 Tax=Pristionchus pacificus TaxID=54126 RepID=A0A2A6CVJ4_PRIPA|nr:fpn-1.2 [Pristionchus pacificus]|eukprot:PDM82254.1 fpn-1.2 [Pristionchus pacificus]
MKKSVQQALLYAAYMCTCLEDRGWSFAISLCMQLLGGMQLVSIEQLAEGMAQARVSQSLFLIQMGFSGAVGCAVDLRSERKWGMIMCLLGNNFSIIASCGLFAICLSIERTAWVYTVCLLLGMLFCSSYRVFVMAEKNLSSRDWVLVLVNDKEEGRALASCSIVSLVIKGALLASLYGSNERLRVKEDKSEEDKPELPASKLEEEEPSIGKRIATLFTVLVTYYRQTVFPAAFGMALLFMTVLGFDGLAIGYGESVGLPENILGFFRSFGSAAGVAGAIMYAVFERKYGVLKTGMVGMITQQICLILAVISIWLPGSPWNPSSYFDTLTWSSWWQSFIGSFAPSPEAPTASPPPPATIDWSTWTTSEGASVASIFSFLIGISTARFGLWMADLAITHIMQIATPESQRNTVFGVHNAICQAFSVMKDLLVIALPSPSTFGLCILISFGFVCTGFAAYIYYVIKTTNATERQKLISRKPTSNSAEEAAQNNNIVNNGNTVLSSSDK